MAGEEKSMKERRWWEVKTRRAEEPWKYAGNTVNRHEVEEFVARGKREGFEVQVWEVVERTETEKRLETCFLLGRDTATPCPCSAIHTSPECLEHGPQLVRALAADELWREGEQIRVFRRFVRNQPKLRMLFDKPAAR